MRRFLMIVVIIFTVGRADAADWSHWRGPYQAGVSPEKDLPANFSLDPAAPENNLVWRAPYPCRSTPIVMNGRVYLINNVGNDQTEQERVVCLDADTGKLVWEHKFNVWHTDIVSARLGWTNLAGDPATGNIYAHGTQGLLLCFDKDGKVLWQHSLTEEYGRISGYGARIVSPTVADNLVIIGMLNSSWGDHAKGGNRFVAFNKDNGEVVWWADPAGTPKDTYYSNPVVANINGKKQLISGCGDGSVVGLNLATGKKLWSYPLGTAMVNCSPVVGGSKVYIGHGEENYDTNIQGRVVCLDAAEVTDGVPKLVWHVDGIKARYASPILDGNRVIFPDDVGKLWCRDAETGKKVWNFIYGRNARGSPLLADGKIYVGEVGARFHILQPGEKKCERLFMEEFFAKDGKFDVEINGTPAAANGRVYFSTSEETYCIGAPEGRKQSAKVKADMTAQPSAGELASLQVLPADVVVQPGETMKFRVTGFDSFGNPLDVAEAIDWSLPTPPLPPGAKAAPPPLKGGITSSGLLSVEPKVPSQQGYVLAKVGKLEAKARVRVAPRIPYSQDFEKVPDGAAPGGWVNTQGKFLVKTAKDGNKVLAKVNDKPSPLVARGNGFIGLPGDKDYTIEADVLGGKLGSDMPDMGIVANRYTLVLAGNIKKLRIVSWDALPRIDRTIGFDWKPDVWYRLKLTTDIKAGAGVIRGKCWQRDEAEPAAWTIEVTDPVPNIEGAPALYGYVTGIPEEGAGTEIWFDNVKVTSNKK